MTRDSTETPPAGEPTPEPAPENAREATFLEEGSPPEFLEGLPVPEPAQEAVEPMSAFTEPLPDEPLVEPLVEPGFLPDAITPSGEPAEIDPTKLDPDALKVIHRLLSHDHQAYLVGGCVRDLLLGRTPKDFDIATSAHPNEVRSVFRNCRLIGRRFRLAHIYFKGGKIIEVSTFRANPTELEPALAEPGAEAGNGHGNGEEEGSEAEENPDFLITHDNVFGTAEQDARRRDFTINGLFYDVSEGRVIDYVRGRRDLDERYIRTIGDPEIRMREDPVRILRAVRFASKLGLDIESRTYAAMEGAVEDLARCAPARLLEETFRLIRGGVAAPSLRLLSALDALRLLLPPVAAYLKEKGRRGEANFYAFAEALDRRVSSGEPLDDAILLAALLYPIAQGSPAVESNDPSRPGVAQVIEELLAEFVQTARLPRRIAERCRLLLIAQRTLSGERRRRTGAFRRHPLFNDALTVFEIAVEATGQHREALEAWKRGEPPPAKATETAGTPEGEGPRKRRRRRRRGGRAHKPGTGEATASAEAGGAEAAGADTEASEAEESFDSGEAEEGPDEGPDEESESESDEGARGDEG